MITDDIVSKSTTESSVTTVISTLTKSSDEEQKSILDEATSADFSKLSGADLLKDSSKMYTDIKEESYRIDECEDRGTPDFSKKSIDLTKDYSKSSIDSKDTSRDFATNELSKDSTIDLTKDSSKASVESVKDASKSLEEKTFSEDHWSLDGSKTLASDASEALTVSKEIIEERKSSKVISESIIMSQEPSMLIENKLLHQEKNTEKSEEKIEFEKQSSKDSFDETSEKPDISELNRRCSNLLEDISQGALIRIDSSHVTQGNNFYYCLFITIIFF